MSTTGTIDIPVRRSRVYYGWIVMIVAAFAMVATLPGRTQGLGLVTEPLLADFKLDRFTFATTDRSRTARYQLSTDMKHETIARYG